MAKSQNKSTKAPDALLEKLKRQDKEIGDLLEKARAESAWEKGSAKGRKPILFSVRMESEVGGLPQKICSHNFFVMGYAGAAMSAYYASQRARTALMRGRIEEFYSQFVKAERALGVAEAMSIAKEMNSAIAGHKAKSGHAKTYAMRKQAINFWRSKVDSKLSAAKAAEYISEMYFAKLGIEISYRTLAKWVAEEKKKEKPRHPSE